MKKNILALSLLLFSCINFSSAQITFQKTFGEAGQDNGFAAIQTSDSGYISVGRIWSPVSGRDAYIVKTDVNGDTLWTRIFGGVDWETLFCVQKTTDGGYILSGVYIDPLVNSTAFYLVKTDPSGNLLWEKNFGGVDDEFGTSVLQTSDGGYIMTGSTTSFGAGNDDVYLIRTDAGGNLLWSKTYGGLSGDYGNNIQQTADGGFIITGYTYSFGAGNSDIYLIKTDANGNSVWERTFGGQDPDVGSFVQQTNDKGYIITGESRSFTGAVSFACLIKTDSTGNLTWNKFFYQAGSVSNYGAAVQQTADDGYILCGSTGNFLIGWDGYLIKTDANGDTLWVKTFGGPDNEMCASVRETFDGGFIICGGVENFADGWLIDLYLVKTDANGNSGCNAVNTSFNVAVPSIIVSSPLSTTTSPASTEATPVSVTWSGGAIIDICLTSGILQPSTIPERIIISPNPSSGHFSISFNQAISKGIIEIIDILGETIFTSAISGESKKEINLNNSPCGIYFVKVFDGKNQYSHKIIIAQD